MADRIDPAVVGAVRREALSYMTDVKNEGSLQLEIQVGPYGWAEEWADPGADEPVGTGAQNRLNRRTNLLGEPLSSENGWSSIAYFDEGRLFQLLQGTVAGTSLTVTDTVRWLTGGSTARQLIADGVFANALAPAICHFSARCLLPTLKAMRRDPDHDHINIQTANVAAGLHSTTLQRPRRPLGTMVMPCDVVGAEGHAKGFVATLGRGAETYRQAHGDFALDVASYLARGDLPGLWQTVAMNTVPAQE